MIKGLQVGFGDPLTVSTLDALRERNITFIRCDLQMISEPALLHARIDEVTLSGLRPLCIITPAHAAWLSTLQAHPALDFELLNEPDIKGISSSLYADWVTTVRQALPSHHRLWAGVISNLDENSLEWLRDSVRRWPTGVNVTVHRYPPKGAGPTAAQHGFRSRTHEVEVLKSCLGTRTFGVSEFGYHTAEWTTGWWFWKKRHRLSDAQIVTFINWEWQFWKAQGAEFACWYQINDGGNDQQDERFGIRRYDGTWKPVADTFRENL